MTTGGFVCGCDWCLERVIGFAAVKRQFTPKPMMRAASNLPALSNYSGRDFDLTIEEVYGLRRWRLAADGTLHPVSWGVEPWLAGVNVARCHAHLQRLPLLAIVDPTGRERHAVQVRPERGFVPSETAVRWISEGGGLVPSRMEAVVVEGYRVSWADGSTSWVSETEMEVLPAIPDHEVPDEWCSCGFYAYNSLDGATGNIAPILGAVRMTGRILVGQFGFRAEKAEVVALLDPDETLRKGCAVTYGSVAPIERLADVYPDVPLLVSREELVAEFPPSTFD